MSENRLCENRQEQSSFSAPSSNGHTESICELSPTKISPAPAQQQLVSFSEKLASTLYTLAQPPQNSLLQSSSDTHHTHSCKCFSNN